MNSDIQAMYRDKVCTANHAAQAIKPGFWIDYGFFNGKPVKFDESLAARKDELQDIIILAAVTLPPIPAVLMGNPQGEVFAYNDFHFSPVSNRSPSDD